ncbi:MAG: TauD/TfdA family dioxygenase [Acidimicrobiia bacterium]|jgi:taurine dioxygenase
MVLRTRPGAGPIELRRIAEGAEPATYDRFSLAPLAATIGGVVEGVDLRVPLDDDLQEQLAAALREWKVLFFRDQHLTLEEHAGFAARWGQLTDDQLTPSTAESLVDNVVVFARDAETKGLENEWHSDGTFRPMPTMGTVLRAIEVPAVGGDTLFADMAAAYDNLPGDVRERIVGMRALHDWSIGAYAGKYADRLDGLRREYPPVEHPVVIRHPETGRATLFVNRLFTREICGLEPEASDELLAALCSMVDLPELQCRWHWEPGSVAMWDNVAVNHYGANDYFPQRRVMARATFFSLTHDRLDPRDLP